MIITTEAAATTAGDIEDHEVPWYVKVLQRYGIGLMFLSIFRGGIVTETGIAIETEIKTVTVTGNATEYEIATATVIEIETAIEGQQTAHQIGEETTRMMYVMTLLTAQAGGIGRDQGTTHGIATMAEIIVTEVATGGAMTLVIEHADEGTIRWTRNASRRNEMRVGIARPARLLLRSLVRYVLRF